MSPAIGPDRPRGTLTVPEVILAQAAARPDHPALIEDDDVWSYRELVARMRWCEDRLGEWGIEAGDRVVTIFGHTREFVPWLLALGRVGATCVPLNTRSTAEEAARLVTDADPAAVLAQPELGAWARQVCGGAEPIWAPPTDPTELGADPGAALAAELGGDAEAPLALLYTTGSTGRPKGCLLSHRAFVHSGLHLIAAADLRATDRHLASLPCFHVGGIAAILAVLHAGGCCVFAGSADAASMLEQIVRHDITFAIPPFLDDLVTEAARTGPPPSLRLVLWGSQMVRTETLRRIPEALGCDWRGTFGSTECGNIALVTTLEDELAHPGTIGRPVPGMVASIRCPTSGEPLPAGEVGELWVRGLSAMSGYWRAGSGAEVDTAAPGASSGWIRTGDLARRDGDGLIHFAGRLKDIIKTGAENVFAAEVERALLEQPEVHQAAVFGVPDRKWGEAVVAAVVLAPDRAGAAEPDLRRRLRGRLAGYKIPQTVHVVDSIPSFQGKPQKDRLRERLEMSGHNTQEEMN